MVDVHDSWGWTYVLDPRNSFSYHQPDLVMPAELSGF